MKKIIVLLSIFIVILGGILFFWNDLLGIYSRLSPQFPQIEKGFGNLIKETEKQVLTPPPLRTTEENPQSFLTSAGVIQWTNAQREKYGLPQLLENTKLDASAQVKVKDMFENQYFAHESPSGTGVGDLAENSGYEFIVIGENLALGNFKDDEALVQAWMDSPGHRANILNNQYQEIGVAVEKGIFEGKTTWLAVQHFALPLSVCPKPNEVLKKEIEENQNQVEELQKTIETLQVEIQNTRPRRGLEYIQKVEQYNNLVSQYNNLVNETKLLVNQYNNQVKLFNDCVSGAE